MNQLIRVIPVLVLLLTASAAMAAPVCLNGTVASFVALGAGGCSIGNVLFSNFAVTNAGAWVNATVINPDPLHQGLQFGGIFLAAGGQPFVASMSYDVSTPGATIADMHLQIGGVGVVPQGVLFSVQEDILNASAAQIAGLLVGNLGGPLVMTDSATFGRVDWIHVIIGVTIVNNSNTTFNFSEVTSIVSQAEIPEPAPPALLGVGLLGLILYRRMRA